MNKINLFIIGLLLIVGCVPPQTSAPYYAPNSAATTCTTKDCFISAANECNDITMTLTEKAGVIKYSSRDCTFTKTMISLDAKETQEMKNLLEGKSLTCRYERGKFDNSWANSLLLGTEGCEGQLKDILVDLVAFL